MTLPIENLSIIGCGQVGTSILLAMATQGKALPTTIYDGNPETEELLRARFAKDDLDSSHITFTSGIAEAVKDADLIILATPMSAFEKASREIATHAKSGAIITDTGSAKKVAIENILKGIEGTNLKYVAAHPGNGGQGAGPSTGSAGNILGRNSTMFLISDEGEKFSPPEHSPEKVVNDFWTNIGVTTAFITTQKHDEFFGQCSHFQHALVFALMGMATADIGHNFKYAGTALRNLSRVAISPVKDDQPSALLQMWQPIFEQNKTPILGAYSRFERHFKEFIELVKNGMFKDLEQNLSTAKAFRDSFDDPERREIITGEIEDLRDIPPFDPAKTGALRVLFNRKSNSAAVTNLLLPIAIAYAQTMSAKEIDGDFIALKANPSFRDGTHPVTYNPAYVVELIKSHAAAFLNLSKDFQGEIKSLAKAIEQNNEYLIEEYILFAQQTRNGMPSPRKNDAVRENFEVRKSELV